MKTQKSIKEIKNIFLLCYLTQLCPQASFCMLLKEELEDFGMVLAGSLCRTSGHQQIVLIYVLQKKILFMLEGQMAPWLNSDKDCL